MKRLPLLLIFLGAILVMACRGSLLNPVRCRTTYGPWDTTVVRNAAGDSIGVGYNRWWERVCE